MKVRNSNKSGFADRAGLGAILLTILPELLRGFGDFRLILYGLALTLVVLFMPGGMVQTFAFCARLRRVP